MTHHNHNHHTPLTARLAVATVLVIIFTINGNNCDAAAVRPPRLHLKPRVVNDGNNNDSSSSSNNNRPNLLFLMADQLRYDALSLVNPGALTPNIDSLGKQGIILERTYSTTPTCTPARAALLTGQKPWNHGMLGYGDVAKR